MTDAISTYNYDEGEYIIAFLDMLSCKDRLSDSRYEMNMIKMAYDFLETAKRENRYGIKSFIFSDNIAMCIKVTSDMSKKEAFTVLIRLTARYMKLFCGFPHGTATYEFMTPIRGAISIGHLAINEELNFIIGNALVEAYKLEGRAKYPRVIIDHKLDNYAQNNMMFKKAENDFYYLDFLTFLLMNGDKTLTYFLKILMKMIDHELGTTAFAKGERINGADSEKASVYDKYAWFKDYVVNFAENNNFALV